VCRGARLPAGWGTAFETLVSTYVGRSRATTQRPPLAHRVPHRSHDVGEPRDDLPGPVRAGRGELRGELARCLRTGRTARRRRGRNETTGRIPGMGMITDRPAEAADRAVPGHREGDLILGKANKSAVGTLVERTTRFVLLLHLPDGRNAWAVDEAMRNAIA
jgi:hypothetical protein